MSWRLDIHNPMGGFQSFADDTTIPYVMRMEPPPEVRVDGIGRQIEFKARIMPHRVSIPPRSIVKFTQDGTVLFWGVVITCPSSASKGAGPLAQNASDLEEIVAVGAERLIEESIVGPYLIQTEMDMAEACFEFCDRYAHGAITVTRGNFVDTGMVVTGLYAPEMRLSDFLDSNAARIAGGAVWWIDTSGAIHFEANP